jgi:DNA processing protein
MSTAGPAVNAQGAAAPPGEPEVLDRLRLAGVPGLSPRLVRRLVARFGSARAALAAAPAAVAAVPGLGEARAGLLVAAPSREDVSRDLARARAASASVLVEGSAGWPPAFAELDDPPTMLFVRGDPAFLVLRGVAIVGSRRASAYGTAQARRIAAELAAVGVPVISGLARGIDAAAHRGALDGGGVTIGVLGGGLARFYPPENVPLAREIAAGRGAVVSEFPLDAPPRPYHFPRRNRVIAALSAAVVVVEAAEGSGSLITADHALDLGREVLAVPGRVDNPNSRGVHRLLREGAAVCESAEDVLRALGLDPPQRAAASGEVVAAPKGANAAEEALLAALVGAERHADELLESTGLEASKGLAALSALELRGAVTLGADGRYGLAVRGRSSLSTSPPCPLEPKRPPWGS